MHSLPCASIAICPFWSRNRLTFLQIARYQGMLGSDSTPGANPMDAISNDRADLGYSDAPPVIVAASSDAAMRRGLGTIEASGLRVADRVTLASAAERIEKHVSATAVWIEL